MVLVWILSVAFAILLLVKWAPAIRRFKARYDFAQTLPGPSTLELISATRNKRLLAFLGECRQKYGPVFRIWLAQQLIVFFTDPDDAKTILTSNSLLYKARSYDVARPWLGNGLVTNGGDSWHQRRKLLTPAFHFQILSSFREPMEECCDILIGRLASVADGRPVDIYQYVTLFALDVICETAMGIKVNAQKNQDSDFVKATQLLCTMMYRQVMSAWKRIAFLYQFSEDRKIRDNAIKVLHDETRRVIKLRRSQLDDEQQHNLRPDGKPSSDDSFPPKQRVAFLESLLLTQRQGGRLTDADIQEEVDTFMFEGHDTTSSAITFVIYMLSTHPEAQRLVHEEVSRSGPVGVTESLPYLEAVIKETLRLYPSVPSFSRQTKKPFVIRKIIVPVDVTVSVFAFWLHREPAHFPEPESFRPERHLSGETPPHPFAQVAFSAGPRNCIGQRFAMLELKCSLARLVRAFEFQPVAGFETQLRPDIVLKSANGVQVQLLKRAGSW